MRCGAQPKVVTSVCPSCGGNVLSVIEGAPRSPQARGVSAWRQVDRSDVDALLRTYQEATERRRREQPLTQGQVAAPPTVDVATRTVEAEVLALVPKFLAVGYQVLPLQRNGDSLLVAVADDPPSQLLDLLRAHTGLSVTVVLAPAEALRDAIARHHGPHPTAR